MRQIIFKTLWGSQAHGTAIETSDTDYRGIFFDKLRPSDYLFNKFDLFHSENKDDNYDSIFKLKLQLEKADPDSLQLIYMPTDNVIIKDSSLDRLIDNKHIYLTKNSLDRLVGYANEQIIKACGLNKKANFTDAEKVRQHPINFVNYTLEDSNTYKLIDWLNDNRYDQDDFTFNKINGLPWGLKLYHYKTNGLFSDKGNEPKYSEVPKDLKPILSMLWWNQQGYSEHCKKHKEYLTWLNNKNDSRYINTDSGQTIDGKNMLHARRLVDIGFEVARTRQINIRRPNRQELLDIRYGKVNLSELVKRIKDEMLQLADLKANCNLPSTFDHSLSDEIFYEIYSKLI